MKGRVVVLVAVWILAVAAGLWSYRQTSLRRSVGRVCDAADAGDWARALEGSETLVGTDFPGLRAAECRARALVATRDVDGAVELLDGLLSDPEAHGWMPDPFLVMSVVAYRRLAGRLPEASGLVRRATAHYPGHDELVVLEAQVRAELEDEGRVVEEIAGRLLDQGRGASPAGLYLVRRLLERRRPQLAERLLGPRPPAGDPRQVNAWFKLRTELLSQQASSEGIAENSRRWEEAGGDPAEILAWEALQRSIHQVRDVRRGQIETLRAALERQAELADRQLVMALYFRLIGSLVFAGRSEEALEVYDAADREFDFPPGRREEILRTTDAEPPARPRSRRGRVRFSLAAPRSGVTLLLSPDPSAPLDTDYDALAFTSGSAMAELEIGPSPRRWVLRDSDDRTLASGALWPTEAAVLEVAIQPRPPPEPSAAGPAEPAAADGRRRVIAVILDCADWRLVQYLRVRRELPALDALIRGGRRAVLDSDPPFTAVAMKSLVFPEKVPSLSTVGTIYRLGAELAGNTFIDSNPVDFLGWLLPQPPSLFETLGAGELVAVNFLHAPGNMKAGEHGEQVGPGGERRRFDRWSLRRPLRPGEIEITAADLEGLNLGESVGVWLEETAAFFDAADEIAASAEIDVALLRLAPLDLITHLSYADISRTAQDDAAHPIFTIYRYADRRLGELYGRLDADDVLVVMSDHGIDNSAEHDRRCFFVAAGGEITPGRVAGTPHLRGVARMVAELLGVETDWPATGIEAWVRELPEK